MVGDGGQREVRLALVMTGGVSLAVWMGGVAGELYRATQAEGLYGRLQRATATTLTIDVIAGASAGGLNGAFLGMALARGTSSDHFDKVRDLWLEVGSFDLLMRNPWHPNLPSLLRGDDYFMVEMQKLLRAWPAAGARDGAGAGANDGDEGNEGAEGPTVVLTCSLLSPDRRGYEDDFGTRIDEPVHRGRFRFTGDALARGGVDTDRLALAARTSASFPGAFEPSFVPIGEGSPERPDMASVADFRRSRWAVDGGVLLNKPVGPALDLISQRPSDREVRRILAYVNPDPGASPGDVADQIGEMPPLGSVVLDSLVTLPRTETIAADLDDIRRHNRRMASQSRSRLSLLTDPALVGDDDGDRDRAGADPAPLVTLARRVYPVWLRKRTEWSIDRRLAAHYERHGLGPTSSVSPGGTFGYAELRDAMVQVRADFGWGDATFPDLTRGDLGRWGFGFHPLEYATTVALDLIRRAYALLPASPPPEAGEASAASAAVDGARAALGACRLDVHEQRRWLRALRVADSDYWASALARVEAGSNVVVRGSRRGQTLGTARLLHAAWLHPLRAYRQRTADMTPGPAERDRQWAWVTTGVLATGDPDPQKLLLPDDPAIPRLYEDLIERARRFTADDIGARAEQIRANELELAYRLARILRELAAPIRAAIAAQAARREGMDREAQARRAPDDLDVAPALRTPPRDEQLRRMANGLALGSTAETILERLLALYVVHMTTEDGFAEDEIRIELLQVSANTPSPLDPNRTTAASKLAGLQLGHFGAFLKESWRANDWMWGTLDGSANVVLLLLEPARLRQRFTRAADAVEELRKVVCTAEAGDQTWTADDAAWFEENVWARQAATMTEELRFVDDPDAPLPSRLPVTTAVLTEAVQLAVARRELPVVKDAVERTTASGGGEPREASIFVGQVRAAAASSGAGGPASIGLGAVGTLLRACAIGQEKATDEVGTDAGAALAARAAAVATGVASGARSGLGKLRHAVQPVRTASLGVHLLAASAARQSRAGFAATTVLLAIGAGAVAAKLLGGNVPDAVLVVALVALAAWVAFTGFTVGVRLVCLPVAALVGVVALSYIEPERVCPVFAARCGPGQPQPEWKDPLAAVVPAVLAVATAGLLVLGLWRYGSAKRWRAATAVRRFAAGYDTTAAAAAPGPDDPALTKARRTLVTGLATLVVAVVYRVWLHDALFEQRAGSPWIDTAAWLARNQALVALLVLPLAFIALAYARTATLRLRRLAARRRAARAMTTTLTTT